MREFYEPDKVWPHMTIVACSRAHRGPGVPIDEARQTASAEALPYAARIQRSMAKSRLQRRSSDGVLPASGRCRPESTLLSRRSNYTRDNSRTRSRLPTQFARLIPTVTCVVSLGDRRTQPRSARLGDVIWDLQPEELFE